MIGRYARRRLVEPPLPADPVEAALERYRRRQAVAAELSAIAVLAAVAAVAVLMAALKLAQIALA